MILSFGLNCQKLSTKPVTAIRIHISLLSNSSFFNTIGYISGMKILIDRFVIKADYLKKVSVLSLAWDI